MTTDSPATAGEGPRTTNTGPPAAQNRPGIRSSSSRELRRLLTVAVAVTVIATLYVAQAVLIQIALAAMLSFVLTPLVNQLGRVLWRGPAVILSVLLALGVIGGVGTLLASQAAALGGDAAHYSEAIQQKVDRLESSATNRLASLTQIVAGLGRTRTAPPVAGPRPNGPPTVQGARPTPAARSATAGEAQPVVVRVAPPETSPFVVARQILEPVVAPLESLVIVLILAMFILMQKEDVRDRFIRLVGGRDLHRTTKALDDAAQRLSRFLLSQLAVNTTFGLVIGVGLWIVGIPSPALWGVLGGLFRFAPYVGSLLAAVGPLALGAAVDPGWSMVVEVAALFLVVEPLTAYVVEPLLYGHYTGLSPVSVIVAAIFWSWMWGPMGLILSTPLTLCLVVVGRHVEALEMFDVLLGDRPALSPAEHFYQRILAENPDEALDKAELLLADRTLLDYYDDVVLQGLKLAAADEARGAIDREQSLGISRAVLSVIDDLSDYVDPDDRRVMTAPVANGPARVVCVAGGGPFDEAVTAMLAQLLGQRNIATTRASHASVARYSIGQLDLSAVHAVAISYLELEGSPARVRSLVRRFRARAPEASIIIGLWPEGDAVLTDLDIQQAIGADRYVGSLRQLVSDVLERMTRPLSGPHDA